MLSLHLFPLRLLLLRSVLLFLTTTFYLTATYAGEEADNRVTLPPSVELDKLTDLVAQTLGISVQFGAGKIVGTVRVTLAGPVGGKDLWSVYHQLLANGGFTTVIHDWPPVYHVVSVTDAPQFSRTLTTDELARLPYPPGYQVVLYDLKHISSETTMKLLTIVFTSPGIQIRSLGGDGRRLLLAAPAVRQIDAAAIIRALDQPGRQPTVRLVRPERTTPAALQASVTAAWNALGRIDENPHPAEVMVAPDGLQLLLIATANDLGALEGVVHELDRTEPVETRTYRPHFFSLDEVANLITQTTGVGNASPAGAAKATSSSAVEIVRDNLTGSLIIKGTAAEHERIKALIKSLDDAPATARRQARTIQVKHRRADEISRMVITLISPELGMTGPGASAMSQQPAPQARPTQPATNGFPGQGGSPNGFPSSSGNQFSGGGGLGGGLGGLGGGGLSGAQPMLPAAAPAAQVTVNGTPDGSLLITSDPVTNRLLVLGEPRIIDQVQTLVTQLDQYQPQVDIEFTLVSLTDEQSQNVSAELVRLLKDGATTTSLTSLFGSSTVGTSTDATARAIGNAAGFGSVVLRPGQYAAVLRALETVNEGRSVVRSQLVVNNNSQATLNSVIQQPIASLNTSTQAASSTFAGTSDAGTQITISPQISPSDYVTLAYSLVQSSFLGEANSTSGIPQTKRNDNVSSTATVPDGYVIALGGLTIHTTGKSESRIPLLGSIPYLGALFRSRNDSTKDSKFFVFIRVSVLRRSDFSDLRYVSEVQAQKAGISHEGDPQLEPQFIR
jgi:general secretion pathway protein D